jgi:hypothetical protein
MNRHKALRNRAAELCVEWLKTMVPEGEEADKINVKNYQNFLPDDTHYYAGSSVRLHAMTPKWIYKQLKKNPNVTMKELLNDI